MYVKRFAPCHESCCVVLCLMESYFCNSVMDCGSCNKTKLVCCSAQVRVLKLMQRRPRQPRMIRLLRNPRMMTAATRATKRLAMETALNLVLAPSHRKQVKKFESPHAWRLFDDVSNFGSDKNNVRMVPHAPLEVSWLETFAGA